MTIIQYCFPVAYNWVCNSDHQLKWLYALCWRRHDRNSILWCFHQKYYWTPEGVIENRMYRRYHKGKCCDKKQTIRKTEIKELCVVSNKKAVPIRSVFRFWDRSVSSFLMESLRFIKPVFSVHIYRLDKGSSCLFFSVLSSLKSFF